jgi:4-hydroxy-3-methylbut-2-enyl diphosphate reductase
VRPKGVGTGSACGESERTQFDGLADVDGSTKAEREKSEMKVILAAPRGFCAGVNMAIESLDLAIEQFGTPVYVYHEIVHNKYVVEAFQEKGAIFVERIEDVPAGSHLLFSAHGVSPEIRRIARERNLIAVDATCPLVTKVHLEAIRFAREGYTIVLIGHAGHDEVLGTMGEAPASIVLAESPEHVDQLDLPNDGKLAYLTQTTLSVDDANRIIKRLKQRFPHIVGPPKEDICYATQNRQEAIRILSSEAEVVLVVGSQNSSNSLRLKELAREHGIAAYLIDGPQDLDDDWFSDVQSVVITAGASAPESLVEDVVDYLRKTFDVTVEHRSIREEEVHFQLPKELRSL